ncbi:MAG: ribosome recycling factor [Lachnospiraceae bacterium]|nr:ribosome recycling factor [Lachnospiraceae bacterium]
MSERTAMYEEKMGKTLKNLETELQSVRAGRANPHVLDKVTVDYYGSPTPIQSVASVAVPEPRMIQIQPWDTKLVKAIVKAIQKSDIGINPSDDGRVIRLIFPELTEERRKALAKDVKKMGENSKVACRNIRRDGNDALKKLKKKEEVSEDEIADAEEELQKITDKYIKKIDQMIEQKTKELMTI